MKKDVDMMTKKLSDIVEDMLSLPEDDTCLIKRSNINIGGWAGKFDIKAYKADTR